MAIAAEAAQTADAGLGGSDHVNADGTDGNADDPYSLSITRDRDGTEIKITDHGMTGDDDPKFTQAMDLGGGRTMHTRMMEADDEGNVEDEVVIVSTDIEGPKGVAFAMWQNAAGETPQALNAGDLDTSVDADGDGTPDNDYTALTVASTALMNVGGLAAADTGGTQTITYVNDPDTPNIDERSFKGTYNGAPGTYVCTGTSACTTTTNDKGVVTAMGGDAWTFTPDSGATSDQPDHDYLHYGVWLMRTTDKDGAVTYNEVETFAGSSIDASTGSELDVVEGSASYEGDATGVYVHEVRNADGTEASATSGHFTAAVSLTAYFAQTGDNPETTDVTEAGTVAPNLLNTVSGTINNFMLSGGEANTWSVAVQASRASGANTFSGTAKGGSPSNDGSISGTYHGPTPETPATNDPATARTAPGSMVGEFNSFFTNGSVAGAFGARKD